jgi:hypothetical protein
MMNDLTNAQRQNNTPDIIAQKHAMDAHEFLVRFLAKFDSAKPGGIHDFMEISLFNMVNLAVGNIDKYLTEGHKQVSANEIMSIVADSYQTVLDNMKRNLEKMGQVNLK